MGAGNRLLKFGSGGLLGAGVGTVVAVLWAPQSGEELKGRLADRLSRTRLAGAQAKAEKEDELIRKFRDEVDDPEALRDEEAKVRLDAAQAIAAVGQEPAASAVVPVAETGRRLSGDPVVPGGAAPTAVVDRLGGAAGA